MQDISFKKEVWDILQQFNSTNDLKKLFAVHLNYDLANGPLTVEPKLRASLAADPTIIATAGPDDGLFQIIYLQLDSDKLLLTPERLLINSLLQHHPDSLFVFSNKAQDRWHFVNVKPDTKSAKRHVIRRITVSKEERLRTAAERISMLDISAISPDLFGLSLAQIQQAHDVAFDVEKVTDAFFKAYKEVFKAFQDDLEAQTKDRSWAHDYALQFLNRCMFLYFVQRLGWMRGDREFFDTFWRAYRKSGRQVDSFFKDWLSVLFFDVFSRREVPPFPQFPKEINDVLRFSPYLNGGLFARNELDEKHDFTVTDKRFSEIFDFLEGYNFTISEDTPFDQEVAVDPEMIGKVYESLVNVSEEADERGDAGIFYTPRTEIDLMCRLSLVDNLANHLGEEHKSSFYELVFAFEPNDKDDADKKIEFKDLWPAVNERLRSLKLVDPACGSGSFLVGMLYILDDLQERANKRLGVVEEPFERRKRIIGRSLYGVDVMDWACRVAELRLWLALIEQADIPREILALRGDPLLPNLTFNIRCGDSLVEEVGGIDMSDFRLSKDISPQLKRDITAFLNKKRSFFAGSSESGFSTAKSALSQELQLFQKILDWRIKEVEDKRKSVQNQIDAMRWQMQTLDGTLAGLSSADLQKLAAFKRDLEICQAEYAELTKARDGLLKAEDTPFVWDIAFVEVFDQGGFDIVIGNPPYVRSQNIKAPCNAGGITANQNEMYKARLLALPTKCPGQRTSCKIDGRSDLYVYFFYRGLSLLNSKGCLCFITSNSWLDVGYGAALQEYSLRQSHIRLIIDNRSKRSFRSADINTAISLLSAPSGKVDSGLDYCARFVMFSVPFEDVLSPIVFQEIEEAKDTHSTPEYRVTILTQRVLLDEGSCSVIASNGACKAAAASSLMAKASQTGIYRGTKWGGKYLRAPDIYHVIMAKGKSKFTYLGNIAAVNEGKPTGANEFFYPTVNVVRDWGLEGKFLVPGLMKVQGSNYYQLHEHHIDRCFLTVTEPKRELVGTAILRYIEYGEERGINKRNTFRNKTNWYAFSTRQPADLLLPCGIGSTFFCAVNRARAIASNSFTELRLTNPDKDIVPVWTWLNSAIGWLYIELMGRGTLGGGMLKVDPIDYRYMPIPIPLSSFVNNRVTFLDRRVMSVKDELRAPDRQQLDEAVFDCIGLTLGERDAVYEAVIALVDNRVSKADSLRGAK